MCTFIKCQLSKACYKCGKVKALAAEFLFKMTESELFHNKS